jgi:hypothetical protein
LTVKVTNVSDKPVTAFAVSLLARYDEGGSERGLWQEDLLLSVPVTGVRSGGSTTGLRPGESKSTFAPVPGGGSDLVYLGAEVVMVVFEDGQAEGDAREIEALVKARQAQSGDLSAVLRRLQGLQAAHASPAAMARTLQAVPRSPRATSFYDSLRTKQMAGFAREVMASGDDAIDGLLVEWLSRRDRLAQEIRPSSAPR